MVPAGGQALPASEVEPDATGAVAAVSLREATKAYGSLLAADHVDLDIHPRELFTLLGPSGSGKTTVLRLIAGLIELTEGEILIAGEDVGARPTHERNIGMVFQSLALFPHMDVFDNIAFPLRMRRTSRAEIARRIRQALDVVRLPDIGARKISELSGGQQQRVALARALVYDPTLLLLDEPLGALDKRLREEMQLEIVRLHREIDVTIINVTHDQREALMLSDRIGVMRGGRLEQVGPSESLYLNPSTRFVAEFLGNANVVDGVVRRDGGRTWVATEGGAEIEVVAGPEGDDRRCSVVLRSEDLDLLPSGSASPGRAGVPGRVALRAFEGEAVYYEVESPGFSGKLKVTMDRRHRSVDVGDAVRVEWILDHATVIPARGGGGPD